MSFDVPFDFTSDTDALSAQVNANFDAIVGQLNSAQFAGFKTVVQATDAAYGMKTTNNGAQNVAALQAAVTAAIAAGGGIVFIPAGQYIMTGTVTITTSMGLVITGSSASTMLQKNDATDLFYCLNSQGGQGIYIRDLWIEYDNVTAPNPIAIHCDHSSEVYVDHCYFFNCPQAFYSESHSLHNGLNTCTLVNNTINNTSQVTIQGAENYVDNCIIRQKPQLSGGPIGATGITLSGPESAKVSKCHISDYNIGILILGGPTNWVFISDNEIQAFTNSMLIQPAVSGGQIFGVFVSDCYFARTNTSTAQSSGVYVDSNGGAATNVQGIFFINCLSNQFNNAGLEIGQATDVVVLGGKYSSNGLNPSTPAKSAGIALTGPCSGVQVIGADLSGVLTFQGSTQPYGIALSGGCTNSLFEGCDLSGNGTLVPVYNSGQGVNNYIKNCRNYNPSKNAPYLLATIANLPASGTMFNAQTVNLSAVYFGDYMTAAAGSAITNVHTLATSFASGTLLLPIPLGVSGGVFRMDAAQQMALDYGVNGVAFFNVFGV